MNLDNIKLKNGDKIKINNKAYEVLYVQPDADPNPDKEPFFRQYLAIYLHDLKTKSLSPTHLLKYYSESKDTYLIDLIDRKIELDNMILESCKD